MRSGLTRSERRWIDIAKTLPDAIEVICNNYRLGWPQSCGTLMHYRIVAIKGGERVAEYICASCGDHWRDTEHLYDEGIKAL